jgi:cell fate (sporulation/competence/biofilm development) regulator YlbF (YheA/YmcA/DUF963 family)
MKQSWLDATFEVIDEIKSQENYNEWVRLRKRIAEDAEIQTLVEAYQTTAKKYEEAKQYGSYHPDLKTYQLAFSQAKQELYTHPTVMRYKEFEKTIQRQLDNISRAIATSISPKIKHPNDIGILPKH